MDQQHHQLNHNTMSPVAKRSCEKTNRDNGMLAAEFLSDDDNSENNIDNTMYNQEQHLSMNQLAQLNSNMGFQQVQNHHPEHLQDQEKVMCFW